MRSILEKAIVALLNEQHDEANQLMHRFMVARARQIHESLRQGDDSVLDETWNEELSEEYFNEDDLSGLEASADEHEDESEDDQFAADDDADDAEVEASEADADEDAADSLEDPAVDDTVSADDVSPEALETIRDELDKLMSDFETVLNGGEIDGADDGLDDLGADDGLDDTMGGDDLGGDDLGGDDDMAPSMAPSMDDMSEPMDGEDEGAEEHEDEHAFAESEEGDDMDDLVESITSELEKVSVELGTDGKEFGGKTIEQNRKSPLGGKKANAQDAAPIKIKTSNHTGFERETAPSVKDMTKKSRNVNAKADAGRTTVSKEGDKSALINKDFAGGNK